MMKKIRKKTRMIIKEPKGTVAERRYMGGIAGENSECAEMACRRYRFATNGDERLWSCFPVSKCAWESKKPMMGTAWKYPKIVKEKCSEHVLAVRSTGLDE